MFDCIGQPKYGLKLGPMTIYNHVLPPVFSSQAEGREFKSPLPLQSQFVLERQGQKIPRYTESFLQPEFIDP